MDTLAVVLTQPGSISLATLGLTAPGPADVVVEVEWSGISTGTERLIWSGRMPAFPGMGYPLVPGYETVGRVAMAGPAAGIAPGTRVFVPGATCFGEVRGLFGGAASRLVTAASRTVPVTDALGEKAVLLALAATAHHAAPLGAAPPDLIVGHGVLGRLVARLAVLGGGAPTVWEKNPQRRDSAAGYRVVDPEADSRRDYARICDVSGDPALLDQLIGRLAAGGEIVMAGFYSERLSFAFPPAFMREMRLRIAAQWQPGDLAAARQLAESGALSLDGLITHSRPAAAASEAYATAFSDADCLKMILNWSTTA